MRRSIVAIIALTAILGTAIPAFAGRLVIVCKGDDSIFVVDSENYELLGRVKVGVGPHEVAISTDGRYAYAPDFDAVETVITIVDLHKMEKVGVIDLQPQWGPHYAMTSRDGKRLWVSTEKSRTVSEVDLATKKITRTFFTEEIMTHMFDVSDDESLLLASNTRGGVVSVFDVKTGKKLRQIMTGKGAEGIDIAPNGKTAWVANRIAQTVSIITLDDMRRAKNFERSGFPIRVKITADSKQAWITCPTLSSVYVYDTATEAEVGSVRTGSMPIGLLHHPDGKRVLVANQQDNEVSVIDRATMKVIAKIPTGAQPDGMAIGK